MTAALLAIAMLSSPAARAHEIPADVKVQLFVKPAGARLQLLLRVPLQAMQEVEFPRRAAGLLDLARALGIHINGAAGSAYLFYNMNEGILDAPSVFGHYSPTYKIPKGNGLFGPEFQIFSASDAVNRANWFYGFLFNPWPINPLFTPFVQIASDTNALVGAVDNALFFGRMSPALRSTIMTACAAASHDNQKVITALYLAGTSGEFIVQR